MFKNNIWSLVVCICLSVGLLAGRAIQSGVLRKAEPLSLATFDAFGYYLYLPAIALHHDYKQLNWLPYAEAKYHLAGGELYQANKYPSGNYVFKYWGGIAILEAPFFAIAHFSAKAMHYPNDGFSPPYQWALAGAMLFYTLLALWGLRRFLGYYFEDKITALTLLLVFAATNLPQYAALDTAQSHAFILPLYVGILFASQAWHIKPSVLSAVLIGYLIGFATICHPTEIVMLFIPLLWATHSAQAASEKWALVKAYKNHIFIAIGAAFLGILPQLLYWKATSGSWVIDVGSKWVFLNPNWRVLFGGEKGWFVYTPVTIFMIVGLFFIKKYPFYKSVLVFSILNIWIIIAWFDWTYGASYSCRALMQHLPIFALPLAAFLTFISNKKLIYGAFMGLSAFLICVNIFQFYQYQKTILHYRDNNFAYYRAVYLNTNPKPMDMSLLDAPKVSFDIQNYKTSDTLLQKNIEENSVTQTNILYENADANTYFYTLNFSLKTEQGFWNSKIHAAFLSETGDTLSDIQMRCSNPLTQEKQYSEYAFCVAKPETTAKKPTRFVVFLHATDNSYKGDASVIRVKRWYK
jgi:hypothetical protein